jgi:1-aminocyclopropane-1-carboxylate deaminase/D-cysteine desulfhydrase-like pyridoxal-dependent ACC family enzyme
MSAPALLRHLDVELPWSELGAWPTPVERIDGLFPELSARSLYIKRDDASSSVYGGAKVRALEPLLGLARVRGAAKVLSSGACGSNSIVATAVHAQRLGLSSTVVAFPQPPSAFALGNVERAVSLCERYVMVPHWSLVSLTLAGERRKARRGEVMVLPPALMSPLGALGHVSGALELAEQVERGELEPPQSVVIGLGSACTAAGLLLGFWLARGLGFRRWSIPRIVAVQVAPWPLASARWALTLALAAARVLASLGNLPFARPSRAELGRYLVVDRSELGAGYGVSTARGHKAKERFSEARLSVLDDVYSAKIAAGFLRWVSQRPAETTLLWSTHSSASLPPPGGPRCEVPRRLARFMESCRRLG